jgi:hypothetical protein
MRYYCFGPEKVRRSSDYETSACLSVVPMELLTNKKTSREYPLNMVNDDDAMLQQCNNHCYIRQKTSTFLVKLDHYDDFRHPQG